MKFQIQYFTFAMLLCLKISGAAEKNASNIIVSSEIWSYSSYSQQKMGYPLKAGYPVLKSQGVGIGAEFSHRKGSWINSFYIYSSVPASIRADNGLGQDHLLGSNKFSYHKSIIGYKLGLTLFQKGATKLNNSFSSGVLYEFRNLDYASGAMESTSDINLFIGPTFQADFTLNQNWQITGHFDAHFYLPYFNYGSLRTFSVESMKTYTSAYRAFYYQTNFSLGFRYAIDAKLGFRVSISKYDLVGFANRKPSFKVNNIIHHKLDRVYAITVGVDF